MNNMLRLHFRMLFLVIPRLSSKSLAMESLTGGVPKLMALRLIVLEVKAQYLGIESPLFWNLKPPVFGITSPFLWNSKPFLLEAKAHSFAI